MNEPMDCHLVVSQLHLFFDDELSVVQAHEIRVHVDGCGNCMEAFDAEFALRALLRRCCDVQAPPSLVQRLAQLHCRDLGE